MTLRNVNSISQGEKTMTSQSIVSRLSRLQQSNQLALRRHLSANRYALDLEAQALPRFVRESPTAMRYLQLLGPLDWAAFPERDLDTHWPIPPVPYAPFVAACLVKLDQQLCYMSHLRRFLVAHPALTWVLGFPLVPAIRQHYGFDIDASLPTQRHLVRMLHKIPNDSLQALLDETVRLIHVELSTITDDFGQCVSMDTKHILAWVKENNPKAYVKGRYDKTQQPAGDPDCKLGCKRKRNQRISSQPSPPTPTSNPVPANNIAFGEYHWGYASGIVATKVRGWGEFVLAELTLPFNEPDVAYFFPLIAAAERRLGFRPKYGAFDAAYDAFYVYEHFHRGPDWTAAFAAVPLAQRAYKRTFDQDGLPLCAAGLPMPLKSTFMFRSSRFPHQKGCYVCPLFFPEETGQACPISHKRWHKGGCVTKVATSIGARLRYQIDRDSDTYKQIYNQRTATERLNAQATALGIERPHLRNGKAITNLNTLIYVLINLRALLRIRHKRAGQNRPDAD
jgi:hypothetical protein